MSHNNIIRLPELIKKIGLSRSSIYNLLKQDKTFPQPLHLSARAIGWFETSIDEWLLSRASKI